MTMLPNTNNELISMRPATSWRVFMDNRKLSAWIEKFDFLIPFMD